VAIAVMITVSLALVYSSENSDDYQPEISTLELAAARNIVTEAEQATDKANQAAALNQPRLPEMALNHWDAHSLSRLQSLSWASTNAIRRVLQPDKAADYGLEAAASARDQFTHTLVVLYSFRFLLSLSLQLC
jgi:hypothetical protein